MKNILFINYGENWIRGQELCLINLLKNIDTSKYTPTAICNSLLLEKELGRLGITTYLVNIPQISYEGKYSKFELLACVRTFLFFRSVIRKHRIDLIYSNAGLPSQLGYPLAKLHSIPLVTHIHSPYTKRYAWMWLFKFADRVIFVSNITRQYMEKKVTFKSSVMIHNGVDIEKFKPAGIRDISFRRSLGIDDNDIVIGQVGSLIHRKGVDVLLKSFAELRGRYPHLKMILAGDGPEKDAFMRMSGELDIADKVKFVGNVNNSEEFYANIFDINVLASREEALPLTLLEGAACGLPNVGARAGGICEIIEDGVTGYLFEKEDIKQLTRRLAVLVENQELRKSMGRAGRERIARDFNLKRYSDRIEEVIEACLAV